jgi:hypothetical protein
VKWFIPSWSGDFRLETVEEGKSCRLTVVDPTPHEKQLLERFMKKALKKKLVESLEIPKSELVIASPIGVVAPLLVKEARPKKTTITAVRYEGGRLEVVEGTGRMLTDLGEKVTAQEKVGDATVSGGTTDGSGESKLEAGSSGTKDEKTEKDEKAEVAASVKRPTPSCPQCEPGSIAPASEVLLEFLTPGQHDRWARERVVEVTGGLSGHRYLISHRNGRWAQRWGRIAFDVEDQGILHFHDRSVPPEEEVLAAALILEHREPWLRNEATCLGAFRDVFKNPFGDGLDGLEDASFTAAFGTILNSAAKFMGIDKRS